MHDGGFDWLSGTRSFFGTWDLGNVPVDIRFPTTSDVRNAWERFFNWSKLRTEGAGFCCISGTFPWIKNWVIFTPLYNFMSDPREREYIPPIVSDTQGVGLLETIVILLYTWLMRKKASCGKDVEIRVSQDETDWGERIAGWRVQCRRSSGAAGAVARMVTADTEANDLKRVLRDIIGITGDAKRLDVSRHTEVSTRQKT